MDEFQQPLLHNEDHTASFEAHQVSGDLAVFGIEAMEQYLKYTALVSESKIVRERTLIDLGAEKEGRKIFYLCAMLLRRSL